jgi:4-amino-4-deoxy-L-arabinose transferase-like glycosyltransferase
LAVVLLLIGAGLRMGQYAIGAALWLDELAVARNVADKPIRELLTAPLDYDQVAPLGFLLIEKAAITALGNNEYALRLFPLLCALASLPLFADVARRTLLPGAAVLAVALFSLSPEVIGYGSQVKQYSTDVTTALLMAALTLRWWERRHREGAVPGAALLGAVGLAAVWFSQAAVFVLAGLGIALLLTAGHQRDRATLRSLVPIAILWGVGALGAVAWGLQSMSPSTHAHMRAYWAGGFMPLPPRSVDDTLWLWRAFRGFFQSQLRYPLPAVGVLLMLLGAVALAQRHRWLALVLLAPLGVAILASAAHQYPFGDRISLFLLPGILLLAAEGVERVRHAAAAQWRPLGATVVAMATATAAYVLYAYYPMYPKQPMPEVLAYVQARRQPGDAVYVYYAAWQAVGYYGPRYGLPLQTVVIGGCPHGDPRRLLSDLDQFRGWARLWVIISQVGPLRERETMVSYLDAIGIRRDSIVTLGRTRRPSSSAYLYDLTDLGRLRAASAETHILPAREEGVREYSCTLGPIKPPDTTFIRGN